MRVDARARGSVPCAHQVRPGPARKLIARPGDGPGTGLGAADPRGPEATPGPDRTACAQPARDPGESALRQAVRRTVLTHPHRDHPGGLPDAPHARVHLRPAGCRAVTEPEGPHHRHSLDRFLPAHRAHGLLLTPPSWTRTRGGSASSARRVRGGGL
ncbi:hypothetical protein [Streptomyces sp. NE5-10]|uniref:hypothetical protein n=1 Tax=Streptomyces sp. NE5-10 TaxID=2759674 RepID=UPI00190532E7|nr:hypothetical protein [Streptomyces sp. NE5-10]